MKSPKVAIFWLVKGALIFDATLIDDAERYGDCKNHPRGHIDRWKQMQMAGLVPRDVEYEQFPRGRIVFNMKTETFLLLADRCILKKCSLVKKIIRQFGLPAGKTKCATDPHYRCYRCLRYKT